MKLVYGNYIVYIEIEPYKRKQNGDPQKTQKLLEMSRSKNVIRTKVPPQQ